MSDRQDQTMIPAEDLKAIAEMTRSELIAMAEQEDEWARFLISRGRWPSEKNGKSLALWRARAHACREAAIGK